jgi:hypothetical protein
MIKAMTAFTGEIDDVETAVSEIREQLNLEGGLLKNTVGILTCYADFVESEVVKGLCESLPFEVVGSTTLGNAVPNSAGETMLLTLTALTSDDVSFAVGLTEPLAAGDETPLRKEYDTAAKKLTGKPELLLSFAPLLTSAGADFLVDTLTKISGGAPNFGMVSVDHNSDYHESRVIHNGRSYADRYAFVLLSGNIHPRFAIAGISPQKIFQTKGVVTASQGNQLQTVNDKPVVEYLKSVGIAQNADGTFIGINSFPFLVDYNDGATPVVRAMFATTPEGYAVCGGDFPVGATLSVGSIDANEILATTREALTSLLASGEKIQCILMFSCVGRYFTLGYNPMSEIEAVQELMKTVDIPYHFTYSGSEFCPVYVQGQERFTVNRNHNDTLVMCCL